MNRFRRSRVVFGGALVAAAAGAVLIVAGAPLLGGVRSAAPSNAPARSTLSPSAEATSAALPETRLVVGHGQYQILDLNHSELGPILGPDRWCYAIGRRQSGGLACAVIMPAQETGETVVRLALVDARGVTTRVTQLARYVAAPSFAAIGGSTSASATFSPDGRLLYVGHAQREAGGWLIRIDVYQVETARQLERTTIGVVPDPSTPAAALRRPDVRARFEPPIAAPTPLAAPVEQAMSVALRVQLDPSASALVARAVIGRQVPLAVRTWSARVEGGGRIGAYTLFQAGPGSIDSATEPDCWQSNGFVLAGGYYLSCYSQGRTFVRRVGLDGAPLGDTSLPKQLAGGYTVLLDRGQRALFVWDPISGALGRCDLMTGRLDGPVTVPGASPSPRPAGWSGALGDVAAALSRWIAPQVQAKVLLDPALVLSPDGTRLYALGVGGGDSAPMRSTGIYVFDTATLRLVAHWAPTADYISLAVSPDGTLVFAAGSPGAASGMGPGTGASVTVFDSATGRVRLVDGELGDNWLLFAPLAPLASGN